MGWLGLRPNHPMYGSLLRARRLFVTPLARLVPARVATDNDGSAVRSHRWSRVTFSPPRHLSSRQPCCREAVHREGQ